MDWGFTRYDTNQHSGHVEYASICEADVRRGTSGAFSPSPSRRRRTRYGTAASLKC